MITPPRRGVSLIILMYALFASVFIIGKQGLANCEPLIFVGSRMTIAGAIQLLLLFLLNRQAFRGIKMPQWRCLFYLAILGIYLTNALEFWALERLPSFTTCFYYSLSPFIAAIFGWYRLGELLSSRQLTGLVVGFLGFFLPILLFENPSESSLTSLLPLGFGECAILTAVITSVMGWVFLKEAIDTHKLHPLLVNGSSMLIGGLFALTHSLLTESWQPFPFQNGSLFLRDQLLMLIISNAICYNLYAYLVRFYSSTWLSFCGFSTPLFTAILGFVFLSEQISTSFICAVPLVFAGLYLFYRDELTSQPLALKTAS